ncbi:hypothetical protein ACWIUD_08725 [Helicobacter sp. 23-1044]
MGILAIQRLDSAKIGLDFAFRFCDSNANSQNLKSNVWIATILRKSQNLAMTILARFCEF